MSQLRDDIKFPVKELSRSLINPQDVDFDNLIHLLKYVNQTRDYVYVMDSRYFLGAKEPLSKKRLKNPKRAIFRRL